ncbi:uncharacterized protein N7515_009392 [Penicillium bovifimosum]|uniref:SUN domain-containing protein n=1 Tax=Penicillium bovifimosum TaxID=126998 RepID=A0A9W9KUG5_9EURO|nr:uncharacterized protein N7515_009392 [Penicillium bovifimosum]KAJ5121431.1 hypothetical protein N7515_009392 [Penicillium bovifimosum]
MAPKRAARRAGATPARYQETPRQGSWLDTISNIPIGATWEIGASTTTALPDDNYLQPDYGYNGMGDGVTRERAAAKKGRKREPTPDQAQLQQSLYSAVSDQHSDKTPSPPIQHSISTDSSPVQPPSQRRLSNSPMYPSPLQRPGHSGRMNSSPFRHSSVDNASVASWNLERDINDDDLQRTRPSSHGHNITAPPRRVSGLAGIYEENEDVKSEYASSVYEYQDVPQVGFLRRWLSSEGTEGSQRNWARTVCLLLLVLSLMSMPLLVPKARDYLYPDEFDWVSSETSLPKQEVIHSLRNQVSKMDVQMSSLSKEMSSVRSLSLIHDSTPTDAIHRKPVHKVNFLSVALGAIIDPANTSPTLGSKRSASMRAVLWASSFITRIPVRSQQSPTSALTSWEEVGDCWCSAPRNGTSQLSVLLGRDIVAEELVVEHIPVGASLEPEAAPRTIEVWARFKVNRHKTPVKAKLTPEAAPGRTGFFKVFGDATVSQTPPSTDAPSSRETGLGGFLIPGIGTLHGLLMDLLQRSNPFEDPSAYSDDPILGPNFYRIGKVEYDLHGPDYVQSFKLNTIVDVNTIRVDKVVFRVTENWGAKHTCIYRFKLHGHV